MTIDFSKPVQTRDGQPVRILCTDRLSSDYPVVGLVEGCQVQVWTLSGHFMQNRCKNQFDLINIPQRHKHADVIIAWANGATIEVQTILGDWETARNPVWDINSEYRVKP